MTTVSVSRTELGLSAIDLTADPYEVQQPTVDAGTVTWRRDWARSAYVDGAQQVGAVRDVIEGGVLDVDVSGASHAALRTNVAALVAAFFQRTYTLQMTFDGTAWAWKCHQADLAVGVASPAMELGLVCTVHLLFPRQPTPVSGPY